jgi:lipopolysaccharide transport system ATP-binding protein
MKPILEIKEISKKFRLQHLQQPYASLRDSISSLISMKDKSSTEEFWALKDVSFNVYPGESIGIIGKNGAGKSTLLKILSKITPPTSGSIISRGRVASLLEVGTGFHPELTGRENIFLNGSILGMKRKEIQKKFDEIVDFSGVEKFLDTALKHYSSGMQLRLAFAVAAFLEPEILLIDEVLAVGDADFQKKCLGKMDEVTKSGRTILFVSHNMQAIESLCKQGILLKDGTVQFKGEIEQVIKLYNLGNSTESKFPVALSETLGVTQLEFTPLQIISGQPIDFSVKLTSKAEIKVYTLGLLVYDEYGRRIAIIDLRKINGYTIDNNKLGKLEIRGKIESFPLIEGKYELGIFIDCDECRGNFLNLASIEVKQKSNLPEIIPYSHSVRGFVELNYSFHECD